MAFRWTEAAAERPEYSPTTWSAVSRRRPCPICGKPDWCSLAADGSRALCMRVGDRAEHSVVLSHGIGYFHRLTPDTSPRLCSAPPVPRQQFDLDFEAIVARWQLAPPRPVQELAEQLGVDEVGLRRLDVVWAADRNAWAFPMHDDRRTVVGIRLRGDNGSKFSVSGSHAGIFVPRGLESRPQLLIVEGPTDVAAALTLGFDAVGRPSCTGGAGHIANLLQFGRRRDVVIVADSDPPGIAAANQFNVLRLSGQLASSQLEGPGQAGARLLADRICGVCRSLRIIDVEPHRDLRAWLRAGGDRLGLQMRIAQTTCYQPEAR